VDEPVIDCHVHVFDPVRFPYAADADYAPTGAETGTLEQLRRTHDVHGVRHALLVGPNSGYGEDNRYLLSALASGAGRFRGMAVVPIGTTPGELSALRDAGVLGVTLNAALLGVEYYADAGKLLASLADLDMIADVQVTGDQLPALAPLLARAGVRVHVDHCGRPDPSDGLDQAGFRELLRLGRDTHAVVKLSGLYKFSRRPPPHEDTWPFVRALVDSFGPDRCLWASDWPFLRAPVRLDYGPLLASVEDLVPDRAARRQILWDTPCREFGFGPERPGADAST
jgi:predicted TIM-barrel fold metal-dependent hydrolase